MITPMKKVTILTLASHKEETLKALREMEIIHLTPLQNAVGASVNGAKGAVARVQKAMEVVPDKLRKGVTPAAKGASGVTLVEEIQTLISDKKNAEIQLEQAKEELEKLHAFGNLDPRTVKELAAKGIFVRLYLVDLSKEPFEVEGDNAYKHVFGKDENGTYIAVFTKGDAPASVKGAFTELAMPLKSLEEYRMIEEESNTTISAVDERFAQLASVKDDLEDRLLEVTDRYNLVEASASMLQNKGLAALQGFCPEPRVAEISAAAKANGWGIRVEDPTDEDNIPTLLGYNKLSRPMQCLYDIIGISPGYNEVDVSSVFLCFFSLFFAMIVGDMAYGLLFLGLAMFARSKMPKASSAGFHFVYLMSWATIIWGAINANFLGLTPELAGWSYYLDIANYNFIPEGVRNVLYWIRSSAPTDPTRFEAYKQFCETFTFLPASFVPKAAGPSQMQHIQLFCFCIAVVHLSIAHAWNVVVRLKRKSSTFMAQVGWLMGAWVMFFLACNMVLGIDMPKFVIPMFIVEVVLLVLFTVPPSRLKQDFISIPMLVLDIVNSFTDVISYIRLFAVGMSGAAIAEAFNGMLSPLFGSAVGVAGAALVLLGVHGLNIALAVMGVAVHAVRLNTLEFSNGLGLEWSGFAFSPFAKQKN